MGERPVQLNAEQRRAVEYDGGPLIVLAGPGTGKTRVIVHRIERLIKSGAEPESIVALTFTVKAASELRERLCGLVGQSAADRVNAHTIHGFGYRLLRRFGDRLGLPARPRILDSAQRRRLLRQLVRTHDLFARHAAAGRDALLPDLERCIDALRHSAIFPCDCEAFLKRPPAPQEGDEEARLAAAARRAHFEEVSRLYALFDAGCRERGLLAMEEMVLLPIVLLRDHEEVAAVCRDEFRHVVVDEFQDVNTGQIELLRQLCPPRRIGSAGRGPDLCVVGDDDQSIYEFRGADDRAFGRFEAIWTLDGAPPERIALSVNYRSESPVVRIANAIMARAESRFAPDKVVELPPERATGPCTPGAGVEGIELDDDYQAGDVIAAMILADRAAPTGGGEPRRWSDYAVIARSHLDLDRAGAALGFEGIPVTRARPPSALDDRGVQDLLRWIELLVDPTAWWAAQWILTRPPFSVPASEVGEWAVRHRAQRSRARAGAEGEDDGGPVVDWLLARQGDDPAVVRFGAIYAELRDIATRGSAHEAVFAIIRRADIVHAELLDARERAKRVGHLAEVLRFVQDRLPVLEPPADLASFWSYYQDLDESEQAFRAVGEEQIDGGAEEGERPDAVTLLTAHSAKGLEFDTVFVPRIRPPHGYPSSRAGDEPDFPEGLIDRGGRDAKARRLAEERRLFYVACTRAQRRLVLMAKRKKSRGKTVDFFEELTLDERDTPVTVRTADEVLRRASELGVKLTSRSEIDEHAAGAADAREARRELLAAARREARLLAARALDEADRPDAGPEAIGAIAERLREAAQRIAVAARVEAAGEAPAWALAKDSPEALRTHAARLAELARRADERPDPLAGYFKPLTPPLRLSYSWIMDYESCPRCFYLRRIVQIPEPAGAPQIVGTVAHKALERFYKEWMAAEADSRATPGLARLVELGRRVFFEELPGRAEADAEQLRQVTEQLTLAFERLHDPLTEVQHAELRLTFPYTRAGVEHTFVANLDRVDLLPTSGNRIVDYKTGRAKDSLVSPKADDLQMGVYALALRAHQGLGGWTDTPDPEDPAAREPARGVAEYWLLSTGQRGRIDLSALDYERITARINKAIDGMLAGEFPRGRDCNGLCEAFGGG